MNDKQALELIKMEKTEEKKETERGESVLCWAEVNVTQIKKEIYWEIGRKSQWVRKRERD